MAITVLKRPYARNWSGNPIHYSLYSSDAEAEPKNSFEIKVMFKRRDATDFTAALTLPFKPVNGTAKVDIEQILDGLMEFELPYLPASYEYGSPYISNKATGYFYIQFREITEEEPDPEWDDSEAEENTLFVIKGGISWEKWRGDNYWVNYFNTLKPFLTWQAKNALHSLTERMYLSWLNVNDIFTGDIQMKRTVRFTDGSEDVAYLNCPVPLDHVIHFPCGAAQLVLEEIDVNKTIYWWQLQVYQTSSLNPEEPLSEAFRFYADNRKDYNETTLNFRNSLGGIDSLRIRGVIDYSAQREFTTNERVVLHDYFANHFINGKQKADNSSELVVYKAEAGFFPKEEQDRVRDFHFLRECWWEQQLKWLPVMVLTQSARLKQSNDKLFSFPVEFAIASGGEFYYTPKNVNLNEASEVTGLVCTAVIGSLSVNYVPGTGYVVTWSLVSGSPVKYFVSTPGYSGGAPGETTSTSFTFPWLPVGDNVITVWPLCYIGGVFYPGAAQQVSITVEAVCVNVGISSTGADAIVLPAAIEDQSYFYALNLTGTAPFTIDNIVCPSWMSVDIVGSQVQFSGTPGTTDIGDDFEVSFDLGNCAGAGTLAVDLTIDVQDAVDNGAFELINEAAAGNFIKNVFPHPPFYTFTSGSLPVLTGETATGLMTASVSGAISVSVVIASVGNVIELYKNSVLQESIDVPGSGIYSFAVVAFDITDDMTIKLKLG